MNFRITNSLPIAIPEGIVFSLPLAGPVTRFLAWLVDLSAIFALSWIIGVTLGVLGIINIDLARAAGILAYFLISIFYGIFLEWFWNGQTIGKRFFRLRVIDERGLRLHFSQIVIRNLLRFVDSLPVFYLVGGTVCLFSKSYQRLGDIAANTVVIWNPEIAEPDLNQIMADKYNSFRDYPHLEARLRQYASPRQAGIAMEALLRRDGLDSVSRVELFREIATHFKKMVEFPAEATEGISDEQYVRNVVDVLFRRHSAANP
ncbi:RDD family protein [Thermodesulfobacteriota bacterium]